MDKYKRLAEKILSEANIVIDGTNPWDMQVHNEKVFNRAFTQGSLGLGEAYMDGWWDAEQLDQFFYKFFASGVRNKKELFFNWNVLLLFLKSRIFNTQGIKQARSIGEAHYDIGNDLFSRMLDKRMVYTCGYWKNAADLDAAQEAKLDLVCKKVGLKPGMKVLDIGCGWGSFGKFAAERYQVQVVGITVSEEQVQLGNELCKGLPVELRLQDYREVNEPFDSIISLGMFEHVGYKNYRSYMEVVNRCLRDDGLFLLHTIGSKKSVSSTDPWLNKYIFPNSMLPSLAQISKSVESLFVIEDIHNFGADYDLTLMAWFKNFDAHWSELEQQYGDRFYRMWKYYLLLCAALFRARETQLWQIVMSKKGVPGGYTAIR